MKKSLIIDYLSCIAFKLFGPFIRLLPLGAVLFFGRRLGDFFYCFDFKHKAAAYCNIKTALGGSLSPRAIKNITKAFYRNFAQNIIEIFLIPKIDKPYINKYISIEGFDSITQAFRRGKGVILAGMHEGSWELSNIISANMGFPFVLFVRNQRLPNLNRLLNSYRVQKGCKIIQRESRAEPDGRENEFFAVRKVIEALKRNEAVGMTLDQGGRTGTLAGFLGRQASMPNGAVRLALKYDAAVVPVFFRRVKGPYHKIIIGPVFEREADKDVPSELGRLIGVFEKNIRRYPAEYLWTYKIWKYGREKRILILSDGKTGHLRQSQAAGQIIKDYLKDKGINASIETIEVRFKSVLLRLLATFCCCLPVKFSCQGCLRCLEKFLTKGKYGFLSGVSFDIVISCGSSLSALNYILSKENRAKAVTVLRPSVLAVERFGLVVMPKHDNPPKRENVVVTEGALNLIDERYLKEQVEGLKRDSRFSVFGSRFSIGLLIGGDTKDFRLSKILIKVIIEQIKHFTEKADASILVTTSRRTSPEIERLIEEEFRGYLRCSLLVIANKENLDFAAGGILGLSDVAVISAESISMVSEAASSGRYTVVFKSEVSRRHRSFLDNLVEKGYIFLIEPEEIAGTIEKILTEKPKMNRLDDKNIIRHAIGKLM